MDDKVIVTHRGALKVKYGARGYGKVAAALKTLIAADARRGIKTRVVYLDDAAAMRRLRARPLIDSSDCRAAKAAIDGVFKKLEPDYVMILGGPDVIPYQDLKNPAHNLPNDEGDDDPQAWGDLPYACDTPYGRDTAAFVGPTRVVGRLPDLTGAAEPSHLLSLLKTASRWKCRDGRDYQAHFALSAYSWRRSSAKSLDRIFGANASLLLAPPRGPSFRRGELGARMHFINCHGGQAAPEFYGQKGKRYPVSFSTRGGARAIHEGTVASVECCYGAELYDSVTLGLDMPICQGYLRQGAYGYLGSTTIAYGPADTNGAADLVCQHFLRHVLEGASIGRAMLMARQQFVEECGQMDPIDLKTLAQFCLYGDPSIHPVAVPDAIKAPKSVGTVARARFRRHERRARLKDTGEFLQKTKPTASKRQRDVRVATSARSTLANIAARGGLPRRQRFAAFKVKGARERRYDGAKLATAPSRYYLAIGRPGAKSTGGRRYRVVVIAKELNGQIIDYRIYQER